MNKEFLDYDGLVLYDSNIKNYISDYIETKHANDATTSDVAALSTPAGTNLQTLSLNIVNAASQAFLNATEETVQVVVTTSVQNVSVSNLVLNIYYNGSDSLAKQVTTDSNGMVSFKVPNGYSYRIVFPTFQGCKEIIPVVHTAAVTLRSVEVEYVELPQVELEGEDVTVILQQKSQNSYTKIDGGTISVTVDGTTTSYTANALGKITFTVPYSEQYSITAALISGWYIPLNGYTLSYTAEQSARSIVYTYYNVNSGLFVVDGDGNEYTLPEFEAAVEAGTVLNSNAKLIAVKTTTLINNGGTFAVDIDHLRNRDYGSNCQWNGNNAQFNSIPLDGNSTSANYYYDGLTASRLIQAEGDEKGLGTPAVDRALGMSRVLAEGTADERTLPGFLGAVGQWAELWQNAAEVDDILVSTRPEGSYLFSTLTSDKWSCTQKSATNAWYWNTVANGGPGKDDSKLVVPFFAF